MRERGTRAALAGAAGLKAAGSAAACIWGVLWRQYAIDLLPSPRDNVREASLAPVGICSYQIGERARQLQRRASVPVLTFVSCRRGFVYECQNQRDTSKNRILVWFWI